MNLRQFAMMYGLNAEELEERAASLKSEEEIITVNIHLFHKSI